MSFPLANALASYPGVRGGGRIPGTQVHCLRTCLISENMIRFGLYTPTKTYTYVLTCIVYKLMILLTHWAWMYTHSNLLKHPRTLEFNPRIHLIGYISVAVDSLVPERVPPPLERLGTRLRC